MFVRTVIELRHPKELVRDVPEVRFYVALPPRLFAWRILLQGEVYRTIRDGHVLR